MGHIKEPDGIDFIVDPKPLSAEEKKKISDIIAYYKATGKKTIELNTPKNIILKRKKTTT
jgi:hypothetical protein